MRVLFLSSVHIFLLSVVYVGIINNCKGVMYVANERCVRGEGIGSWLEKHQVSVVQCAYAEDVECILIHHHTLSLSGTTRSTPHVTRNSCRS